MYKLITNHFYLKLEMLPIPEYMALVIVMLTMDCRRPFYMLCVHKFSWKKYQTEKQGFVFIFTFKKKRFLQNSL